MKFLNPASEEKLLCLFILFTIFLSDVFICLIENSPSNAFNAIISFLRGSLSEPNNWSKSIVLSSSKSSGLYLRFLLSFSGASASSPEAFSAVKSLIHRKIFLEEFLIQAITRGTDDVGKVHIQIENKGNIYYGFSANTDIITASVEALIDAVSKII